MRNSIREKLMRTLFGPYADGFSMKFGILPSEGWLFYCELMSFEMRH